MAVPHMPRLSV